jgi:predicted ATPase/class 3 adenylate cyclase
MDSSLPTGTVTFLMTDIEGSTRLWEEHHYAMGEAIRRHDELAAETLGAHGGDIIKARGEGDSLFVIFPTPVQAIEGAIAFSRAIGKEEWPAGMTLRFRAAIHTGQALAWGQDYYGPTVNRCARLRSVGFGGQILISGATKELISAELPNVGLRYLGSYKLKDLDAPEEIWQCLADGLPADFPPLRALGEAPTNLPSEMTTFIGRDEAMAEISLLFDKHRMVTLTGTGGGGKSRLAVEVARSLLVRYPNGAWFVELADLTDGDQIPRAIQASLRLPPMVTSRGIPGIVEAIKDQSLLIVLDNCEHLLRASAEAARTLLMGVRELKILATSREPTGAPGEVVRRVPSLRLPVSRNGNLDDLAANESVALFIERARAQSPEFALTAENAQAVSHICRTVEGIPLALELAAARIRVLKPEDLARRLEDRFRVLTGNKTDPLRHQTLHATIEWSYRMLGDLEREAFEQLSVFAGGWTMEMAERTCGDPISEFDLLDILTALVDKSLVNFETSRGGRYSYLETIRQFARDQLAARPETEAQTQKRHAEMMADIGMDCVRKFRTTEEPAALQQLVVNTPNVVAAISWAKKEGNLELLSRLTLALSACHQRRGYPRDGIGPIDELFAVTGENVESELYARLLCERAALALDLLENDEAEPLAVKAKEIAESINHTELTIRANNLLGQVAMAHEDFALARTYYNEALRLSEQAVNWVETARLRNNLGIVERRDPNGDKDLAAHHYREALEIQRAKGHTRGEAETLNSLGVLEQSRGNFEEAAILYVEAGKIETQLDHAFGVAKTLSNYGEVLAACGKDEQAVRPLGIAEHFFSQVHSPYREYTHGLLTKSAQKLGWSLLKIEDFRASCGRVELSDAVSASLPEEQMEPSSKGAATSGP